MATGSCVCPKAAAEQSAEKLENQSGKTNITPMVEFPRFDGSNLKSKHRAWITKCNRYFKLFDTITDEKKVLLASLHMEGRAEIWFESYVPTCAMPFSWDSFVKAVYERFDDVFELVSLVDEYRDMKPKENRTVTELRDKLEELWAELALYSRDEFIFANFICGLNEEFKIPVMNMRPKNLDEAIEFALEREKFLDDQKASVRRGRRARK